MLEIESLVLGADAKRLRFAHVMMVGDSLRATFECMALHFDSRVGRTAPFPDTVQAAFHAARVAELPDWAGRGISLGMR